MSLQKTSVIIFILVIVFLWCDRKQAARLICCCISYQTLSIDIQAMLAAEIPLLPVFGSLYLEGPKKS